MNTKTPEIVSENGRVRRFTRQRSRRGSEHPNTWIGRYLAFAAVLLIAVWLFTWTSRYQLTLAAIVVTVVWVISVAGSARRAGRRVRGAESKSAAVLRGIWSGILTATAVGSVIWVAQALPSYGKFIDRDRSTVEAKVSLLEETGDLASAADIVSHRLQGELSDNWRQHLEYEHVRLLTLVGERAESPHDAIGELERAIQQAAVYGIEASVANSLLKRELQLVELERKRIANSEGKTVASLLSELTEAREFGAIDRLIRNWLKAGTEITWNKQPQEMLYENLIAWGDHCDDACERHAKYTEAVEVARAASIPDRLVSAKIEAAEAIMPCDLPAGTAATLTQVRADEHSTLIELKVSRNGKHFPGLSKKDFRLFAMDEALGFDSMELDRHDLRSVSVLVLLDQSPSTRELRQLMYESVDDLVAASPEAVRFRVMSFAETTELTSPWTCESEVISASLRGSRTERQTSLHRAVLTGVDELRRRDGTRFMLLVSDGANTSPTDLQIEQVAAICRDAKVRVISVAIGSKALNRELLSTLAQESRGLLIEASDRGEFVKKFATLRALVKEPLYWLRVERPWESGTRIKVLVGRGPNACEVVGRVAVTEEVAKARNKQ